MATQTKTQVERILNRLQSGTTLTSAQARAMGIQRLPARIHEIREMGLNVQSTPYTNRQGVRAVKYSLSSSKSKKNNTSTTSKSRAW